MNSLVPIEKDIPVEHARSPWKYPLGKMEVGDSILVTEATTSTARTVAWNGGRRYPGRRYITRREMRGTRIFRVV
jgi:hypothetical protein